MTRSALDAAHAAMQAGDEAEARAFYRLLADAPAPLTLGPSENGSGRSSEPLLSWRTIW